MKLTLKQKRFVDEYMIDLNGTQAAIRAGYSPKTADVIAAENLVKPNISAYLSRRLKERSDRTEITQDRVLKEYARLAFIDPRKFYDDNGNLMSINKVDEDTAACLTGFEVVSSADGEGSFLITKKIRMSDKKGALDSIAKHLGMFNDKSSKEDAPQTINISFADA